MGWTAGKRETPVPRRRFIAIIKAHKKRKLGSFTSTHVLRMSEWRWSLTTTCYQNIMLQGLRKAKKTVYRLGDSWNSIQARFNCEPAMLQRHNSEDPRLPRLVQSKNTSGHSGTDYLRRYITSEMIRWFFATVICFKTWAWEVMWRCTWANRVCRISHVMNCLLQPHFLCFPFTALMCFIIQGLKTILRLITSMSLKCGSVWPSWNRSRLKSRR